VTSPGAARRAVEAVWRIESPRLIAGLARLLRDLDLAEDLAQDALLAALERWPESGVPDNPGAWLMATAKHRAIDQLRRRALRERKRAELGREIEVHREMATADLDAALDDEVGDDVLRLMFVACHPLLAPEARVALTLRLLGGLSTFGVPRGAELGSRLASVMEVLYLVFNEGYAATAGRDWTRPDLCAEALRLGRVLTALAPREPEAHGLVALMEIQASRLRARVGPRGEPILLLDQDRGRWDPLLIRRGLAALRRAEELGGVLGPYALQAAIAACHARAPTAALTRNQRERDLLHERAAAAGRGPRPPRRR
jgi:predicted RNA polymerase sigma factor